MHFFILALFLMLWEEKVNNMATVDYPSDLRWVSKFLISESFFLCIFHFAYVAWVFFV